MRGNQEAFDSLLVGYLVFVLKELNGKTATALELTHEIKTRANVDIDAGRVNRLLKKSRAVNSKPSLQEENVQWSVIS